MYKKIVSVICICSFFIGTVVFAAEQSVDIALDNVAVPSMSGNMSQEEFQRKTKSAKTTMIVGGSVMGAGLAAMVGGIVYMSTANTNNLDWLSKVPGAGIALVTGSVLLVGGGVTMIVGAANKSSAKKKYYSTIPVIDPYNNMYGMNFSVGF